MLIIRKCLFPYCTEIFLTEHYDLETKYHSDECYREHMKYSVRGYKFDLDERAKEASRIKDEKCRNGVKSGPMEKSGIQVGGVKNPSRKEEILNVTEKKIQIIVPDVGIYTESKCKMNLSEKSISKNNETSTTQIEKNISNTEKFGEKKIENGKQSTTENTIQETKSGLENASMPAVKEEMSVTLSEELSEDFVMENSNSMKFLNNSINELVDLAKTAKTSKDIKTAIKAFAVANSIQRTKHELYKMGRSTSK